MSGFSPTDNARLAESCITAIKEVGYHALVATNQEWSIVLRPAVEVLIGCWDRHKELENIIREEIPILCEENETLRARVEALEKAAKAVIDWYELDGSVGGSFDAIEELKKLLKRKETK